MDVSTTTDALAVLAIAVAVIGATTWMAIRRPLPPRRPGVRPGGGPLVAFVTWGGVLVAVALAVRGRTSIAVVVLAATLVHGAVVRVRASRPRDRG